MDGRTDTYHLQKWLDYYGPFEAVVDGANVGLYSQKRFRPPKAWQFSDVSYRHDKHIIYIYIYTFNPRALIFTFDFGDGICRSMLL